LTPGLEDLALKPDLEKPPGLGPPVLEPEREPEAGLPEPPKLGLVFQSGPAFLSAREVELG
jgi:hypothetical protein